MSKSQDYQTIEVAVDRIIEKGKIESGDEEIEQTKEK